MTIPPDALEEMDAVVRAWRARPLPLLLLDPTLFELTACTRLMAHVRARLDEGPGIVLLDRVPLERLSLDEAKAVYWLLGRLLSSPVATKWNGTMLYDVTDTDVAHGYGVRGAATSAELVFHNDNSYGVSVPDYVSLLCAHPAVRGGETGICSLHTVHNVLLACDAPALDRLYEAFYFDRQAEHGPGEATLCAAPIFSFDGKRLRARVASSLVRTGYALIGEPIDEPGERALDALSAAMHEPEHQLEFSMQRGQIQYLANGRVAHRRTRFEDPAPPGPRRHLVRMWYRDTGGPFYDG